MQGHMNLKLTEVMFSVFMAGNKLVNVLKQSAQPGAVLH